MLFFSIITPAFNTAEHLSECISSILSQTFSDFELILVNDGSTDSSGDICDYFARRDSRVRVIHSDNRGVSTARNLGIAVACGQYVWCVDSDDYLPSDALSQIEGAIRRLRSPDLLCCAHFDLYPPAQPKVSSLPYSSTPNSMNSCAFLEALYRSDGAFWGAGFNIYRREAFSEKDFLFNQDLVVAEDCDLFLRLAGKAAACAFLNEPVYVYRRTRTGSASTTMSAAAVVSQLRVYSEYYWTPPGNCPHNDYLARRFFARKFAVALEPIGGLPEGLGLDSSLRQGARDIVILRDAKGFKYVIARMIWRTLGLRRGSRAIRRLRNIAQSTDM